MSGVLVATVMQAVGAAKDWLAGTVIQEPLGTKGYNASKEILRDQMADKSLTKILSTLMVEPTIIVTESARQSKIYDKVATIDLDIFTSFYVQVFYVLTQLYNKNDIDAIDLLSTNRYTGKAMIETARRKLIKSGLELSQEDILSVPNNLDQLDFSSATFFLNNEDIRKLQMNQEAIRRDIAAEKLELDKEIFEHRRDMDLAKFEEDRRIRAAQAQRDAALDAKRDAKDQRDYELRRSADEIRLRHDAQRLQLDADRINQDLAYRQRKDDYDRKTRDEYRKQDLEREDARRAAEKEQEKIKDREAILENIDKDALKQLLIRNVELRLSKRTVDGNGEGKGDWQSFKMPITIIGTNRIVSFDELRLAVSNYDYKKSFKYRWNEWRSGGISLANLVFASDLIQEYKKNKLSKSSRLFTDIEDAKNAAIIRKTVTGNIGTECSYNMVIMTQYEADALSKLYKKDLNTYEGYQAFLRVMNAHNLTILDEDNERVKICITDIKNHMDIGYARLMKRDDKENNLMDFFKNLVTGSVPKF